MTAIDDYLKIKKKVDRLQVDLNRSEGRLLELFNQLKEQFKCKSIKAAKVLLERMESQVEEMELKGQNLIEEFEEEYSELLDE